MLPVPRTTRGFDMNKEVLNLSIHEYCGEDDTLTVQGRSPRSPDLKKLAETARKLYPRIILMERLDVLVVIAGKATVHIHGNGDLVVNGVRSLEEAKLILDRIMS